jgi:hypothetical protein
LLAVLWALLVAGLTPLRAWGPALHERLTLGGASRDVVGVLMFLAGVPWLLRPVWAAVSDRTVVGGRRHHVLLTVGALFFALASFVAPHTAQVFPAALLLCVGNALVGASLAGIVVTLGRATRREGLLAAMQTALPGLAAILSPLGHALTGGAPAATLGAAGLLTLSLAALAWPGRRAPPLSSPAADTEAPPIVRGVLASRELWLTALVLALVQTDVVDKASLGFVQPHPATDARTIRLFLWATAGGATLYGLACRAVPLRRLLPLAIALSAATKLPFLTPVAAESLVLAGIIIGAGQGVLHSALVHLTMRAAPVGREALVFVLLGLAHAAGAVPVMLLATRFVTPGGLSSAPVFALVTGAIGLLATRLLPRTIVDRRD